MIEIDSDAITALATVVIAVATIAYVVVARGQLTAIGRQADIATNTASTTRTMAEHTRAAERAWIIVQSTGLPEFMPPPGRFADAFPPEFSVPRLIKMQWSMSNHGKSPAWIAGARIIFELVDWPLPDAPPPLDVPPWHDMPITTTKPHEHREVLRITEDQWYNFMSQKACFVLYGLVEYRDVFGLHHRARFCETWMKRADALAEIAGAFPMHFVPMGPTAVWTEQT